MEEKIFLSCAVIVLELRRVSSAPATGIEDAYFVCAALGARTE
jgi:hypothetical protein